jgi:hypothetical protein
MKKFIPALLFTFLLSACNGWVIQPIPLPTPFLPATLTPSIFTATPVVIGVTSASATPAIVTVTPFPTNTSTATPTDTPFFTPTNPPSMPSVVIQVLGCNTSIDISHGMGEVTNAYVTLKNTGNVQLTNLRVTLYALDEGREHPDKTVELTSLPVAYQVSLKLTVDSTYKQETPIQVEVTSDQGTFPREGLPSCRDIGILAPNSASLNTPVPSSP